MWSGGNNGDCEIPYSADYFEKLNECRHDDANSQTDSNDASKGIAEPSAFFSTSVNYSENSNRIVVGSAETSRLVSSTAVCETMACRDVSAARKTVAVS